MDNRSMIDEVRLNELLDYIDNAKNMDVEKLTWGHLASAERLLKNMENGRHTYQTIYSFIQNSVRQKVETRVKRNGRIKVAFLAISAAEWPGHDLYNRMMRSPLFEPCIVVTPPLNRRMGSIVDTYTKTYNWFVDNGYRTVGTFNTSTLKVYSRTMTGFSPDILIHLTFWNEVLPAEYNIENMPMSMINLYIPYGILLGDNVSGTYSKEVQAGKAFNNLMYAIFSDTQAAVERFKKYSALEGINAVYSGYLKMDYFYHKDHKTRRIEDIWKIPEGASSENMLKLLYTPHYSLGNGTIRFGTFGKNYQFFLELAGRTADRITWTFKPHPNLRAGSVAHGIFKTEQEYDLYIEQWNQLPNAKAVEEGSYIEEFYTSDAIINDSVSFVAEYLYTNHPMLFLTREGQTFNELGKKLFDTLYKAEGDNFEEIERFIDEVAAQKKDKKKEQRMQMFDQELDYVKQNGKLATDYIYDYILKKLVRIKKDIRAPRPDDNNKEQTMKELYLSLIELYNAAGDKDADLSMQILEQLYANLMNINEQQPDVREWAGWTVGMRSCLNHPGIDRSIWKRMQSDVLRACSDLDFELKFNLIDREGMLKAGILKGNVSDDRCYYAEKEVNILLSGKETDYNDIADIAIDEEEIGKEVAAIRRLDAFDYDRLYLESKLGHAGGGHIRYLAVGSSYGMVGLTREVLGAEFCNCCVNGQDLYYSLMIARDIVRKAAKVDTVIIPFSYYFAFMNLSKERTDYALKVIGRVDYPVTGSKGFYEGELETCDVSRMVHPIVNSILDVPRMRSDFEEHKRTFLQDRDYYNDINPRPENGMLSYCFRTVEKEQNEKAVTFRTIPHGKHRDMELGLENRSMLEAFLAEMKEQGIRVILFVPPVTSFYAKASSPELKRLFDEIFIPVFDKSACVFEDLFESGLFTDEDFQDYDHLNERGALRLSQYILQMEKENG